MVDYKNQEEGEDWSFESGRKAAFGVADQCESSRTYVSHVAQQGSGAAYMLTTYGCISQKPLKPIS